MSLSTVYAYKGDKMNPHIKWRLLALGLAVPLMGALIIVVTLNSQRQGAELRVRLNQVDSESFGIAEHFKDSLREMNNLRLHYAMDHEPARWQQYLAASRQLDDWIDRQALLLTTDREKQAFWRMKSAYEDYLRQVQEMQAHPPAGQPNDPLAEFLRYRTGSQHVFDLGQDLARAHYESRNEVLTRANRILAQLRVSVLWLVGFLFLFGVGLAVSVYQNLIAPLRIKLVESEALAGRHEKLAALGLLAAGVAHEIRNPLTAIKAALFIQQKKFTPETAEYDDVKLVEREILRLERIVNDFLAFARPTEPEMITIQADQPLREVQALLGPQLARAGIRVVQEELAPLRIHVDPAQIKQVLINLVQNAADSIGCDGLITLRARFEHQPARPGAGDVVILEVEDTGKGIPPEVEKRLFDPFFTTKERGTGLGLSLAARIVEKHGGSLQYQTLMDHGTTFGIVLPKATV